MCLLSSRPALLAVGLGVLTALATICIWQHLVPHAGRGPSPHTTANSAAREEDAAGGSAPSKPRRSSNAAVTFDCMLQYSDWKDRWSREKKEYCCKTFRRGCNLGFNCKVAVEHADSGWSDEKRVWCCRLGKAPDGVHCSRNSTGTSTARNFDCDAGFRNSARGWSEQKKAFCCKYAHRACPARSGHSGGYQPDDAESMDESLPYDCTAGLSVWRIGWSPGKKTWCCDHGRLGCQEASGSAEVNATVSRAASADSAEHNSTESVSDAYDCCSSPSQPESEWTDGHKAWCCLWKGRACPSTLQAASA